MFSNFFALYPAVRWVPAAKNLYRFVKSARMALAHQLQREGVEASPFTVAKFPR